MSSSPSELESSATWGASGADEDWENSSSSSDLEGIASSKLRKQTTQKQDYQNAVLSFFSGKDLGIPSLGRSSETLTMAPGGWERSCEVLYEYFLKQFASMDEQPVVVAFNELQTLLIRLQEDYRTVCAQKTSPGDVAGILGAFKTLERVLIPLLGHPVPEVRERTVILLNVLYDGHELQLTESLNVSVQCVGETADLEIPVHGLTDIREIDNYVLCLSETNRESYLAPCRWLRYSILYKNGYLKVKGLPGFSRSGFYDWYFAEKPKDVKPESSFVFLPPVSLPFCEARLQKGRIIVHPSNIRDSLLYELPVDQVDATWDSKTGELKKRGSFDLVAQRLPDLRLDGITHVYLMGALARPTDDPEAPPGEIADRSQPAAILGGAIAFKNLVSEANRLGVGTIVDGFCRVSRNAHHRKYNPLVVYTKNSEGLLIPHAGTDGRELQWDNTCLLNYRKFEAWELFYQDIYRLIHEFGIQGVRLDNAQSYPLIMKADLEELFRVDVDGELHYSLDDILHAKVVKTNEDCGYWLTEAALDFGYPNPFLVRLTKRIWNDFPNFIILAEAHFQREPQLAFSGVIPHTIRVAQILASICGQSLRRDGSVSKLPESRKSTARTLSRLYRSCKYTMPKGAIQLGCTCTHNSPYPGVLYGRRAWLAVDLLYFLPEVPILFYGEENGRMYRFNMATVSQSIETHPFYDVNYENVLPKSPRSTDSSSPADGISTLVLDELSHLDTDSPPSKALTTPSSAKKKKKKSSLFSLELKRSSGSSQSLVRSQSIDDVRGMSIRSVSVDDIGSLSRLEEDTRLKIGPGVGYDIRMIRGHYEHRLSIRMFHPAFRHGSLTILDVSLHLKEQVFAFVRSTDDSLIVVAMNMKCDLDGNEFREPCEVELDFKPLSETLRNEIYQKNEDKLFYFLECFTKESYPELLTFHELLFRKYPVKLKPLGTIVLSPERSTQSRENEHLHLEQCLARLQMDGVDMKDPRENALAWKLTRAAADSLQQFSNVFYDIYSLMSASGMLESTIVHLCSVCLQRATVPRYEAFYAPKNLIPPRGERVLSLLIHLSCCAKDFQFRKTCQKILKNISEIGPLVFVAPELGRFSTAGGLGVMVDELTKGLAALGSEVYVISPYYSVNRKGQWKYLEPDGIIWTRNIQVRVGSRDVTVGVYEGVEEGVHLIFLEQGEYYPKVYADMANQRRQLELIVLTSLASLEVLCQKSLPPALFITNDWIAALSAGYAKQGFFGSFFENTTFFHIIHNLGDAVYEGRVYPNESEGLFEDVHRLPVSLVFDPSWSQPIVNPSRCALLCSDTWGTVSNSYLEELVTFHPLKHILRLARCPFGYPNGIRKKEREALLKTRGGGSHLQAKTIIQQRFFQFQTLDASIPLFCFIGRVTSQKGVHLILQSVEQLIQFTGGKIQFLIGGPANRADPYAASCAVQMEYLRSRYPWQFWAAPDEFFTDGPLVNLGADFGMMPSMFEPGGIVQHEFFVAGTPVIAYRTGGLKDTVHEWDGDALEGNGFTFEDYALPAFVDATKRALRVFSRQDEYQELRKSAYESVIDVSQVAFAWYKEFHRLRNVIFRREALLQKEYVDCMSASCSYLSDNCRYVLFYWLDDDGGDRPVFLKGSFDGWSNRWCFEEYKPPLVKPDVTIECAISPKQKKPCRQLLLKLVPGSYTFKFLVQDEWQVSCLQAVVSEGIFQNNVMQIS
ncbi:starch synthase [Galdieria sulphuraria]|uniref:Starch synthase n=1 Tax=Galdieria sulphuraria TaxID=130081 RepID=M2X4R8_GALSU|nr:starch synthase [Galdieria sulphuraria]EME31445.1 starch synthase [Galdieria sulphuraria]|eukprot:XP_005707965.1 starch synthase [Galdieria sulphuraria]